MFNLRDILWAGTDEAFEAAKAAEARFNSLDLASIQTGDNEDPNPLLTRVGNVAVISITGPLINANIPNWALEMFGVTTYGAIQDAAVQAATDSGVDSILLDINSGGGHVSGVIETADLLAEINTKCKPVKAYASGLAASAAYWLAASAREITAGRGTTVGSIGVIVTHMDYSQKLENDGIKATVMRAGKEKALGQPVEPLTDAAREQIQERLNAIYTVFVEHVAKGRGVSYSHADQTMAQGKEFFGAAAKSAGLVDKIGTFDSVLASLQKQTPTTRSNPMTQRASLLAALMEGAGITASTGQVEEPVAAVVEPTEPAAAAPAPEPATADAGAGSADKPAEQPTPAAGTAPAADPVLAYVKAELAEARTEITNLQASLAQAKGEVDATKAAKAEADALNADLAAVVQASVGRMRIALALPSLDTAALSGLALLAEHKSLHEQFTTKFKSGGLAAVSLTESKPEKAANPHQMAAIQATRFNKK